VNPSTRLYLITPPAFEASSLAPRLIEALDAGDVACVQLRLKDASDDTIRRAADLLRPLVQSRDVAFLMNDRADLAHDTGCDGVHLGQEDGSVPTARRLLGADCIIGATAHASRHLAMVAAEQGADYVAFGAFFPTATKEVKHHASPELLEWWSEIMTVPAVAIGGITAENCAPLVRAGADFLAVIGTVWNHPQGPGTAIKELNTAIARVK